jgi:hypothetical protein
LASERLLNEIGAEIEPVRIFRLGRRGAAI